MTDARSPRTTGHFGAERPTFRDESPELETLKLVISLLSPSTTEANDRTYGLDDQVPKDERGCKCGGTFQIGHVVRQLIDTRKNQLGGRCEGGKFGCSERFTVTVEAAYKN